MMLKERNESSTIKNCSTKLLMRWDKRAEGVIDPFFAKIIGLQRTILQNRIKSTVLIRTGYEKEK